jgi:hypothetical protein
MAFERDIRGEAIVLLKMCVDRILEENIPPESLNIGTSDKMPEYHFEEIISDGFSYKGYSLNISDGKLIFVKEN